jgi:hypothetical protein
MSATDEFIQDHFPSAGFHGSVVALRNKTGLSTKLTMEVVRDLIIRNANSSREFLIKPIHEGVVRDRGEVHLCGRICTLFGVKGDPWAAYWKNTSTKLVAGTKYHLQILVRYNGEIAPTLVLQHNGVDIARTKASNIPANTAITTGACLGHAQFTATGKDKFDLYSRSTRSAGGLILEPVIAIPEQ